MSYKDDQAATREKLAPQPVLEEEWTEHDKLFMEKSTLYNRKFHRFKGERNRDFTRRGFRNGKKIKVARKRR